MLPLTVAGWIVVVMRQAWNRAQIPTIPAVGPRAAFRPGFGAAAVSLPQSDPPPLPEPDPLPPLPEVPPVPEPEPTPEPPKKPRRNAR